MNEELKTIIHEDLQRYLLSIDAIDERMPDAPDLDDKWTAIAEEYIPDGIREYNGYPTVALGWMMYVGMAVAKMWDEDWETYSKHESLYATLRDKRGYDSMDEYIREEVLRFEGDEYCAIEKIVAECASRTDANMRRMRIEPATKEAFRAFMTCLQQLYVFGYSVQLKRMGYRMVQAQ